MIIFCEADPSEEPAPARGNHADPVRFLMSAASILLVDDDPNTPVLLRHALPKAGFKGALLTIERMEEVQAFIVDHVRQGQPLPDLILLDLLLADGHGFDLLRTIRSAPAGSASFIAALSSSTHPADIEGAFSLGADAYVEKYPDAVALAALHDAVTNRERGRQLRFLHKK